MPIHLPGDRFDVRGTGVPPPRCQSRFGNRLKDVRRRAMNDLVFKTSDKARLRECATAPREVTSVNGVCEFLVGWSRAKPACQHPSPRELILVARPRRAKKAFVAVAALTGVLSERAAE
jgi:hypothetical protein